MTLGTPSLQLNHNLLLLGLFIAKSLSTYDTEGAELQVGSYNHGQNMSGLSAQDFDTSFPPPSPHISMLFFCKILVLLLVSSINIFIENNIDLGGKGGSRKNEQKSSNLCPRL